MKSFVAGEGLIGSAVTEIISQSDEVIVYDKKNGEKPIIKGVDILHICFPYGKRFIEYVNEYIAKYKPMHVIIWSTVPMGTTRQIRGAVHSPVEGRHPELVKSIKSMVRWVGANHRGEAEFYEDYFKKIMIRTRMVLNSDYTEFLKLRSTAKYGINLVWTDYEAGVAKEIGMDFKLIQDFDIDYNKLYHNLGMAWAKRYILNPPNGKIGGHCVVPNAKLLNSQHYSILLDMIESME